ncbi:MAG: hypothetical protein U1C97_02640, partial [Candidatus Gracilibacteria bacterium]|nr:hypothetical protein [Candidatus Gracilibacteria bacterium]
MAKLVRRGLRVLPALSIVAMLVLTATLSFWNTSQAPPAFAADDSITINSTTLALQTDTETNSIADIGDTIRITVDLSNTDGGYGAAGTTVTADLQAYGGGAAENVPGITDTGGTNDIFQLDFVVLSAGGSGIDVAGNNAASAVTV